MLKKISPGGNAGQLKPGDVVFDGQHEETARKFKIKAVVGNYLIMFHGGDFPSLKCIHRNRLASGNWWVSPDAQNGR